MAKPDPHNPDVALKVGGTLHRGWIEIDVNRTIEAIAGSFSMKLTERWPGQQALRAIQPGDACAVMVDGETVITGWIDEPTVDYDETTHETGFSGRDATGDLVDCSVVKPTGTWDGTVGGQQIIADICAPFGIKVSADIDIGTASFFTLQPGEAAFEAIERVCRSLGVLPTSDGQGGLKLTRGGTGGSYAKLQLGRNVLKASGRASVKERYSQYIVHGQTGSYYIGTDNVVISQGVASDPGVKRYRPLEIVAEYPQDPTTDVYQRRANWEATVRAGRARRSVVTVQGWRDDAGALWHPNGLVPYQDEFVGLNETMIIAGVRFRLGAQGATAELTLTRPDAFQLTPLAEQLDYAPAPHDGDRFLFPAKRGDDAGRIQPK